MDDDRVLEVKKMYGVVPVEPPTYGVKVKDGKITVDLSKEGVAPKTIRLTPLGKTPPQDNKFQVRTGGFTKMTKTGLQNCVDEAKNLKYLIDKRWDGRVEGAGGTTKALMRVLEEYIEK